MPLRGHRPPTTPTVRTPILLVHSRKTSPPTHNTNNNRHHHKHMKTAPIRRFSSTRSHLSLSLSARLSSLLAFSHTLHNPWIRGPCIKMNQKCLDHPSFSFIPCPIPPPRLFIVTIILIFHACPESRSASHLTWTSPFRRTRHNHLTNGGRIVLSYVAL